MVEMFFEIQRSVKMAAVPVTFLQSLPVFTVTCDHAIGILANIPSVSIHDEVMAKAIPKIPDEIKVVVEDLRFAPAVGMKCFPLAKAFVVDVASGRDIGFSYPNNR